MGDSDMEILAKWMIKHGYATGHGDTMEDLLEELEWQIAERSQRAVEVEREACAKLCFQMWNKWLDSSAGDDFLDTSNCPDAEDCAEAILKRGHSKPDPKPETLSPAEHRRRTNAPWNDKASY